jgi:hypothetical protein
MSGWIGVDLDGTLAEYHGWKGADHIGAPIPAMVERVKGWLAEGRDVKVFTARVSTAEHLPDTAARVARVAEVHVARARIVAWCIEHIGEELAITNVKDHGMIELWDDRAVQVEPNTGRRVDGL